MMGSLRSRHLFNVITIIIMGILILGALLSISIYRSKTEVVGEELERTALDLLGYIEYGNGGFLIPKMNANDAEDFLNTRHLLTGGKERFAYIWDDSARKIIWDSIDNNDVNQAQVSNNFALFDFDAMLQSIATQGKGFNPAQAHQAYSVPASAGEKPVQYLVAAQRFALKVDGDRRNYLFVVATSMANVEADAYGLIPTLLLMLFVTAILLLIAQLIFSQWVMAPLRKFEQDALDMEKGDKTLLENDYPAELQLTQHAINTVLKRQK